MGLLQIGETATVTFVECRLGDKGEQLRAALLCEVLDAGNRLGSA